jgi:hypothetical protein
MRCYVFGKDIDLYNVTKEDVLTINNDVETIYIELLEDNPKKQLLELSRIPLEDGDILCQAGLAPRPLSFKLLEIAKENKENIVPGKLVDHRLLEIPNKKLLKRKVQEENNQTSIPYIMLIGDSMSAVESLMLIANFKEEQLWTNYLPEKSDLQHWLSAMVSLLPSWTSLDTFPLVDLSIRDLETDPVMYATNTWHDWISYYPSNGNFKLENHVQLFPVWLDNSKKTLEYVYNG